MPLSVDLQCVTALDSLPDPDSITLWARAAAEAGGAAQRRLELSVRLVDHAESRQLNREFRDQDKSTNVLAFPGPAGLPEDLDPWPLGDLVICAPVVRSEALQQHKPEPAHWAHMVIHGTLHLLGFDHTDTAQAQTMEAKEIQILATLGFADPYGSG